MDLSAACDLCLSLPHAEAGTPFGPDVLVFKVAGKLFALTSPEDFPPRLNLKCDPGRALALREEYEAITPGFHMNKRHWNTVRLDGSVPGPVVGELIHHSYDLVVAGLPAAVRAALHARRPEKDKDEGSKTRGRGSRGRRIQAGAAKRLSDW